MRDEINCYLIFTMIELFRAVDLLSILFMKLFTRNSILSSSFDEISEIFLQCIRDAKESERRNFHHISPHSNFKHEKSLCVQNIFSFSSKVFRIIKNQLIFKKGIMR